MVNILTPDDLDYEFDFDFGFGKKNEKKREKKHEQMIKGKTLFTAKDPISALTHFIGFWAALAGMPILLIKASSDEANLVSMVSLAVFMVSMVLLYGASTAYHSFTVMPRAGKVLKKIDHMMIFVLIAGSYTPMCTMVLGGATGLKLLVLIWSVALLGIVFKAFWVTCPKWVSSVIYITMGWAALLAIGQIYASMALGGFILLVMGGVLYSIGGVIYSLKIKDLAPGFGAHEVFHIFVLAGSLCHFLMMLGYVA